MGDYTLEERTFSSVSPEIPRIKHLPTIRFYPKSQSIECGMIHQIRNDRNISDLKLLTLIQHPSVYVSNLAGREYVRCLHQNLGAFARINRDLRMNISK